jgi:predicted HicB family RNase H-like nuclease
MALLTTAPSKVADRAPKILAKASKPVSEEKRLNVRLDAEKHERFRRACMRNESDMTTVIQEFIEQYVAKHSR